MKKQKKKKLKKEHIYCKKCKGTGAIIKRKDNITIGPFLSRLTNKHKFTYACANCNGTGQINLNKKPLNFWDKFKLWIYS